MALFTSRDDIAALRQSGRIAAEALRAVAAAVRPGISTQELDDIAEREILRRGGRPSFKGFEGYPASLCTSINHEVVHGIPSDRRLVAGDIIGLDIGVIFQGAYTDHAMTVPVGPVSPKAQRLLEDTQESLRRAIAVVKPGAHIGDIGAAVQAFLEPKGYGIITQLTGHGVGRAVHEPPAIFNVGKVGTGPGIKEGMVLALEPMVSAGGPEVKTGTDGWTVEMADGSLAAHSEHTVLVTKRGADIITHA